MAASQDDGSVGESRSPIGDNHLFWQSVFASPRCIRALWRISLAVRPAPAARPPEGLGGFRNARAVVVIGPDQFGDLIHGDVILPREMLHAVALAGPPGGLGRAFSCRRPCGPAGRA